MAGGNNETDGVWRTVGGRRIFIKNGQPLEAAMKESGKFSNKEKKASYDDLMGTEYTGVKGVAAIDKLLFEKEGHVKDAFYSDDIGNVDLYWGDDSSGLCHIIKEREKRGIDGQKFARDLPNVIEKGKAFQSKEPDRINIAYKGKVAVITFELHGIETTALLTAFHTKK